MKKNNPETIRLINLRALQNPLAFLLQVPVASSLSARAQLGSILSCHATLATSTGCQRTSVTAMAGPCSVPGEAWASPCWLGSSALWPRPSTLRGHLYKNPDKRTGLCDLSGGEERLWKAQPGQSCGLTPEEAACRCEERCHSCGNTGLGAAATDSSHGYCKVTPGLNYCRFAH